MDSQKTFKVLVRIPEKSAEKLREAHQAEKKKIGYEISFNKFLISVLDKGVAHGNSK